MTSTVAGIPPEITDESRPFWDAAAEGRFVVERCTACGQHIFPLRGVCRRCSSRDLEVTEITGPGRVYSYTINYQPWAPEVEVPYALAVVEFPECPGVRVFTRVRGCEPEEVAIGMTLDVGFEAGPGGVAIPSFVVNPAPESTR